MAVQQYLSFEKPVLAIEEKLEELRVSDQKDSIALKKEIRNLEKKLQGLKGRLYARLTPWQITQVARHPNRPYTMDYINLICEDFITLRGDRKFRDDPAIVGGLATIGGKTVMVVGHQKGRTTKEKIYRNFGMPHPEGYRKALRLMCLAERFKMPIITFIDTPGAYPGVGAEERGQSEAIARNLMVMSKLSIPILSVIIGEGGSGGALAIGVADRIMMMEFSIYSVISPEGCAAILWKDGKKADIAAKALKLDAKALKKLGVIDSIIKEPIGAAHREWEEAAKNVKESILSSLKEMESVSTDALLKRRYDKYRSIGRYQGPAFTF